MKPRRILIIIAIMTATIVGVYLTLPHLYPMFPIHYAHLEIMGISDIYNPDQIVKFQIKATGYGIPCDVPSITIYKSDQPSVVVYEKKMPPFMCPIMGSTFFSNVYPGNNDSYSLAIKDPSRYTIDASFLNSEIKKEFEIK